MGRNVEPSVRGLVKIARVIVLYYADSSGRFSIKSYSDSQILPHPHGSQIYLHRGEHIRRLTMDPTECSLLVVLPEFTQR